MKNEKQAVLCWIKEWIRQIKIKKITKNDDELFVENLDYFINIKE